VTIALLNMIFGIMIDTFSGLREEQSVRDERLNSTCFVCLAHRSEFGEGGSRLLTFGEHIKQEHNISDYILYIAHLYQKDELKHTGLESYIFKLVQQDVTSWLPHKSQHGDVGESGSSREEELAAAQEAAIGQLGARLDTEMGDVKAQLGGVKAQLGGMASKLDQLVALVAVGGSGSRD
jgi:hypothetical protein